MSEGTLEGGGYEQFASVAGEYGVDTTRVSPEEVPDAIDAAVEPPAVGAPVPREAVSLPEGVTTDPTPAELEAAVTGVTGAALGIAEYGTLVLRADGNASEPVSLFNDLHVAILREADIVPDMGEAFAYFGDELRGTRDTMVLATGPSATADMGALVQGAHGPKDVEVIVVS